MGPDLKRRSPNRPWLLKVPPKAFDICLKVQVEVADLIVKQDCQEHVRST
jgi:hypothetical protein